jgi:hypothetical protein
MAKRRVFRTRVKCPGVTADLGPTANQRELIGRNVAFERSSDSLVNIILDGAVVGQLDEQIAKQVASALQRGQVFTAVVGKAFPICGEKWKQEGAQLDIKVEYLLEKGDPAIEIPKPQVHVEQRAPRSFFTKVAGVTHEGRQRIIARCSVGERLILVREPDHRYDKGAIRVLRLNGEDLGFIPADVSRGGDSSGLAWRMDRGDRYQCRISDLTGGGDKYLGVNIEITEGTGSEVCGDEKAPVGNYSDNRNVLPPTSKSVFSGVGLVVVVLVVIIGVFVVIVTKTF